MIKFYSLVLVVFLTSCAATGTKYQKHSLSNTENGGLYILRESKFLGSGNNSTIKLNDKTYTLRNAGYFFIELEPSEYTIFQKSVSLTNTVKVKIEKGKFSYVLYSPSVDGVGLIGPASPIPLIGVTFAEIKESDALNILPELRLSE